MAPPNERLLRLITLWSVPPAVVIFIVAGIVHDYIVCFLCIIPFILSSISSCLLLNTIPKGIRLVSDNLEHRRSQVWILSDLFTGILYLAMLIAFWVVQPYSGPREIVILENYATMPMYINMFIHFYLFLGHATWSHECPNCGECTRAGPLLPTRRADAGPTFSALGDSHIEETLQKATRPDGRTRETSLDIVPEEA